LTAFNGFNFALKSPYFIFNTVTWHCHATTRSRYVGVLMQASTLDVVRVAGPQSGRAKCPYDPSAHYAFIHSGIHALFLHITYICQLVINYHTMLCCPSVCLSHHGIVTKGLTKHVKRQVSATWIDTTKTNNNNAIVENDCVGRAES